MPFIFLSMFFLYACFCEGKEIKAEFYQNIYTYVNCCCFTFSQDQFEEILDEDVKLFYQTNEAVPFKAQGKKAVSKLFKQYVFDHSFDVNLKKMNIKAKKPESVILKLLLKETKVTSKTEQARFLFEEKTLFQFNKEEPYKVNSIYMLVKRTPICNRKITSVDRH